VMAKAAAKIGGLEVAAFGAFLFAEPESRSRHQSTNVCTASDPWCPCLLDQKIFSNQGRDLGASCHSYMRRVA
jgi:hypothetical protein